MGGKVNEEEYRTVGEFVDLSSPLTYEQYRNYFSARLGRIVSLEEVLDTLARRLDEYPDPLFDE